MTRIKKYKLHSGYRIEEVFQLIGLVTDIPLVKLIFDINRTLPVKFSLNKNSLSLLNSDLKKTIPLYVSIENQREDSVAYIFSNKVFIENKKANELFTTEYLYHLYPSFKTFRYFIIAPYQHLLNIEILQNKFSSNYFIHFEELDIHQFKPFPIFPPVDFVL